MTADARRMVPLQPAESIRLLGTVAYGRIVFSQRALPAIRPVNHVVVDGSVIIRTHLGAAMLSTTGMVVAYEADAIDPDKRLGWSVIVTGIAERITDPDANARFAALLEPWVSAPMDYTVRIVPELVTGYALVDSAEPVENPGRDRP